MNIMKSLDHPKIYFRSCASLSNIFETIDHAIMVVASDCPQGVQADGDDGGGSDDDGAYRSSDFHHNRDGVVVFEAGANKKSKVNSSRNDIDDHGDMNMNRILSNYNFGEAEALTDEMEEQSDAVLFESLRRLQQWR
ncbi:probable mediator of RNA polymerase II transcription subunit 26b [Arachis stenosperma]|uniref:probable mediator of RNA polymerase II transcription subunit 26b n=1 Tax=Arachis stenosperma TaxID=217475 RepID=UPI0025AD97A9|nr:probable mediator of RNA polymerase II transcription subunit 26b [Arachis stenosperma]